MPLKQLIFIALSLGFIPTAAWFAIRYQWAERLLFAGALFSTCYLIDINLVSVEAYRGDTRGFEFGVTDWMVIALLIVMVRSPRWRHRRPDPFPPNSALLVTYLVIAMLSVATAYVPLYAGFGVFKLIRAMAVYWVAFNYLRSEEDFRFFMMVLAAMVAFQFLLVIQQRLGGIYRASGSTPHSNTLAMYINMMNMLFLSFLLGDREATWQRYVYWGTLGLGTLIVLATFSRGALAMMMGGYGIVVMLSLYDRPHRHKLKAIGLMLLLALPFVIRLAPAIIDRFETAPEAAELSRHQANDAALAMGQDHLFGIGINNFSYAINNTGYTRFVPFEMDRGIVHNVYLLHFSELGWAGLIVFILMIARFFIIAVRLIALRRDNLISWVAIGIFAGMSTLWLQSMLEWAFRQTYLTVEFFLLTGFLAALPRLDRNMHRQHREQKLQRSILLMRLAARRRQPNHHS